MLDLLADLTSFLGARYDLAAVNFWLSWTGALGALVLMSTVAPKRSLANFAGRVAWARTCALFWLTAALAIGGSYPVHEEAQPWLPAVLLTGTVTVLVAINLINELHTGAQHGVRSAAGEPT